MTSRGTYNTLQEDQVTVIDDGMRGGKKQKRRTRFKVAIGVSLGVVLVLFFLGVLVLVVTISEAESGYIPRGSECTLDSAQRFTCFPDGDNGSALKDVCLSRGCCWDDANKQAPLCYYSAAYGYGLEGPVNDTKLGFSVHLRRKGDKQPSLFGHDVDLLQVDVMFETSYRLHVKIYDPAVKRYEVPLATPAVDQKAGNTLYNIELTNKTFGFTVTRNNRSEIFTTGAGLIFEDQFIQLSALLPSAHLYGLGEHVTDFRLPMDGTKLTLFARDTSPNPDAPGQNLYGVQPFYLCLEEDGSAHGVFLLNSNAMEVELMPGPSITYRTIGGVLDYYFFLGPSPEAVVQQYTELVGRPFMPPYWALGFHLCRWGYGSANNMMTVVERMREKGIPHDTQWNDIDYMHAHLDFTYDNVTFGDLPGLVDNLHQHGQKYIVITDPGISNSQPAGYQPFESGVQMGIFIKNSTGQPIIGRVWPNTTAYPDFTHPLAETYWHDQLNQFHSTIQFDGLWIDMNEPSNFVPGSIEGCPNSSLNTPPFLPGVISGLSSGLVEKTLCMSATQNVSTHYNVHSLYGHTESKATMVALEAVLGKRSIVISRSTYAGSGRYAGHWLGDNASQWRHMANSIAGILDFSLFGIPLVGADICGFSANTTEELCTRWQQLGAFYPFSRNHNIEKTIDQDPAVWSEASVNSSRDALLLRYSLLPYLYSLFHFAHTRGSTVARPLLFEFPMDKNCREIDTQFMWGGALLITPVLKQGSTAVQAYFPDARWFDLRNGTEVKVRGANTTLPAPLSTIPLHVRGGYIIPRQEPNTTTVASRDNPFSLLVALDDQSSASGNLYLDDGDSLDSSDQHTLLTLTVQSHTLSSKVEAGGYDGASTAELSEVKVLGLASQPSAVSVNGTSVEFSWDGGSKVLTVTAGITNLNQPFTLTWSL